MYKNQTNFQQVIKITFKIIFHSQGNFINEKNHVSLHQVVI
jgi:hypothetical protein